ncbi:MAG: CoA transferase, partial [Candidatus Lambdaproteobacteria bacterium]|nr:CoA transferase [Candidatus Lambdaproteobacteria bacterium]
EISAKFAEEVDALLRPLLARHTKDELFDLAQHWGYPLAPLRTIAEAVAEPQFAHRGFFAELPVPGGATLCLPNLPYRFSGWPRPPVRPAPALGADNARILGGRLARSPETLERLVAQGVI